MEGSEPQVKGAVTQKFLTTFLPIWDKIKDYTIKDEYTPEESLDKDIKKYIRIPKVHQLSVTVNFDNPKKKPIQVVIKTPPLASSVFLRKLKYFHKEVFFHDELLTEFKRLLNNCDCSSGEKNSMKLSTLPFAAASISDVTDEPLETFIIFNDVRQRGFKRIEQNPFSGELDFNHCKLVVKELAKLHALSWVYKKSKAVLSLQVLHPIIQETLITSENLHHYETQEPLLPNNVLLMIMALPEIQMAFGKDSEEVLLLEEILRNGQDVGDLLVKFVNHSGFSVKGICVDDDEDDPLWSVGSHGDLQSENLLFRHDLSQNPTEVILLNFSSFRESCPTLDLAYFFYTSAETSTRNEHCQDLLQIYHDTFVYFCTLFKKDPYPGFDIHLLKKKFNQAKIFGLLSAICLRVLPTILQQDYLRITGVSCVDTFAKECQDYVVCKEKSMFTEIDLGRKISDQQIS